MRHLLLAALLLRVVAGYCQSGDADNLKALNAQFIHGSMTRDTANLSRIFADDFILINPSGERRTKQDVLNGFITSPPLLSCEVDTVEIRLYGSTGLVLARAVFTMDDHGKKTTGKTDYLDVYEKRKGRWVAVAAHVTYLGGN
ncbi:MAG TPA: nuclear transport factor 2 family protein [Puia sp.]|jgi:ketosteroid isomerase-like protein|nr:nuclear transport factor 2 family protein [Puia sp.]